LTRTRDILTLLQRSDKWYLGGGNRLLWAPEFPLFRDAPGFWDSGAYYNLSVSPLFTWTLIDDRGKEVPLKLKKRTWNPAVLTKEFTGLGPHRTITITEGQCVLPNDVAVSCLSILNRSKKAQVLHLVLWSAQQSGSVESARTLSDVSVQNGLISFIDHRHAPDKPEFPFGCAIAGSVKPQAHQFISSEAGIPRPTWGLTPFAAGFSPKGLHKHSVPGDFSGSGTLFLGLHFRLTIQPGKQKHISLGFSAAPSIVQARENLRLVLKQKNPVELSVLNWNDHFSSVPHFDCSDEFLTRYYWYRWYGLKLNTINGAEENYSYPFVCEGIGYFRAPISYSAQCHMRENRWMHEPELAQGSLLTFLENQRDDGGFRGYIDVNSYREDMFYHANWGRAILDLDAVHPSQGFLAEIYEGMKKYAAYCDRERDDDVSGMYDIDNHYETGQEYMHRYLAVNEAADRTHWGEVFRLKGVDVTVYVYELKRALGVIAEKLGKTSDAELWSLEAENIKRSILTNMWDRRAGMFFDVDPASHQRTGAKAATCFYPYFTDIVSASHLSGLKKHLFNRKEFWTPYPVPSSSADDPYFSPEPIWKGEWKNCPWNGRVWPMANSHMAEALAVSGIRFNDKALKKRAADFITRFVRMLFFEGDPKRPNCFEHYHPYDGTPSLYRGIDDYQHSWVVDLIIKYVCGVRPEEFHVAIDPFPFGLSSLDVREIVIRGRRIDVKIRRKRFWVTLDGERQAGSTIGNPIMLQI